MAVNEELLKKVLEEIRPNLQADGGDGEAMLRAVPAYRDILATAPR